MNINFDFVSVGIWRLQYRHADCNDAGEHGLGWKPNVAACGADCRRRYPSTKFLAYSAGRGHTGGSCYCERTQHCHRRGSTSSWDVWYNPHARPPQPTRGILIFNCKQHFVNNIDFRLNVLISGNMEFKIQTYRLSRTWGN